MIDTPNVSISAKSNEENIQTIKSYLADMAYEVNQLESRIEELETVVSALQEGEDA